MLTLACSADNILPQFVGAAVGACELCALETGVVVVVDDVVIAGCRLLALLVVGGVVGALLEHLASVEQFHRLLLLAYWDLFELVRDPLQLVVVVVVVVVLVVSLSC